MFFWSGTAALSGQCALAHCPSGTSRPPRPKITFLRKSFKKLLQGSNDVVYVHSGAREKVVGVHDTLGVKKARTICLALLAMASALRRPGVPFESHCLDYSLVSGMCMDTADSSSLIILQ